MACLPSKSIRYRDIAEIISMTLGDVKKMSKDLSDFSNLLKTMFSANPEKVDSVPLYYFFSLNAVEDSCWLSGIPYAEMRAKFKGKLRSIVRVKYIDCIYSSEFGWEILRISPVFPSGEPFN
jgi:hypothetical protein